MSDQDIQFGEVEEVSPERRRRPDHDRHFSVVDCGTPTDGDLPIFIDMDVLADMETHARTDTSVELGGVMLGGQYLDEDGRPFVVISDSLRAEHYESTRGHFKFTHDTWTEISRQRDGFSEDLRMVGWYHTHPDWGVFLSGMDRFICDHFFNRPLDVAMVVDPIRNDRGWFYWRQEGDEQLPRASGFWVTASRFRRRQLAAYVAQLQGKTTMEPDFMRGDVPGLTPGVATQVIHTIRPQMGWMGMAILAMLVLQASLTLVVALRLDSSGGARGFQRGSWQGASDEPEKELQRQFILLEEKLQRLAKADFLLTELTEDYKTLKHERDELAVRVSKLEGIEAELTGSNDGLREQLREISQSRDEALAQLKIAQAEIDRLKSPAAEADGEEPTEKGARPVEAIEESASAVEEPEGKILAWTMGLIVVVTVVLVAIIAVIIIRRRRKFRHLETEGAPRAPSCRRSAVPSADRVKRLAAELEVMRALAKQSSILTFESDGDPPDKYKITLRGRGINRGTSYRAEVEYVDRHECEIRLGYSFPKRAPDVRWLTPISHPNIPYSGYVKLEDCALTWQENLTLDVVCERLWDLARLAWVDLETAKNYTIKKWLSEQQEITLPVDDRPLRDRGGPSPSNVIHYRRGQASPTATDDGILYIGEETPTPEPPRRDGPIRRRTDDDDDILYIGDD